MEENKLRYNTLLSAIYELQNINNSGFTFLNDNLEPDRLSYKEIYVKSLSVGYYLRMRGLKKGDCVALILPNNRDFVLSFLGSISVGIVAVPLYPPTPFTRIANYYEYISKILMSCGSTYIVTSRRLAGAFTSVSKRYREFNHIISYEEIDRTAFQEEKDSENGKEIGSKDTCFIQFTSGSTADPKGVVVSHENIMANASALLETLPLGNEIAISWLPMYHDMGLMLVIAPLIYHAEAVYISPFAFLSRPQRWLEVVNKYRGTITASPNFGLGLATKYASKTKQLDLSSLHTIICGAETIDPNTIRRFISAFRTHGLQPEAVVPAYGMAEATLCITISSSKESVRTVATKREKYEKESRVEIADEKNKDKSVEIVSCGKPIKNHRIGIIRQDGSLASEGEVGEIVCAGPSATKGYYRNKKKTDRLFYNGWILTGDLGFILDGELFVSGRKKDLIIIAGRKYYPDNIERCIERIPEIRKGNVVAFSFTDRENESVVIVAESRDIGYPERIREAVRTRVAHEIGISVKEVVLLKKGSLPKTSSGKLQRSKIKNLYRANRLIRDEKREVVAESGASST